MQLRGKKVLVIGLGGKTGVSAVKYLCSAGADVTAADGKSEAQLHEVLSRLQGCRYRLETGGISEQLIGGKDLVLLSPGVPLAIPAVQRAKREGIPVIGDIELAALQMANRFAGITGTDGKSTTTSMTGSILTAADAGLVAGNIGLPVLDLVNGVPDDKLICLELSSFQLESIDTFKPVTAALLNFAPDHLDRYPDVEHYLQAKLRIFKNLDSSCNAVLPLDDPRYPRFLQAVPQGVKSYTFSLQNNKADCFWDGDRLLLHGSEILHSSGLQVIGTHNRLNAAAAALTAASMGIQSGAISCGLRRYSGMAHRFEYAGTAAGVVFVNDSKATTTSAVASSINSAEQRACFLIGGRDKGLEFAPLGKLIAARQGCVIPFGEARHKVSAELGLESEGCVSLGTAIRHAWQIARDENRPQVVLAPGCTSYDEFSNFEVRGDFFKTQVALLREESDSEAG